MLDRLFDPLARRILRPPLRPAKALPEDLVGRAEDARIVAPTMPLAAWLLKPEGRPLGAAVFVHGWSSDGGRMAPLARPLLARRIAVLLVDLPGHGRTGAVEEYDVAKMVADIAAARDWVAGREELAGVRVGLLGFSFGGVGAYVAAAHDARWSALALLAAPLSPMEATRLHLNGLGLPGAWLTKRMRRSLVRVIGAPPEEFEGPRSLRRTSVPVLVLHGEEDRVVPVEQAVGLAAAVADGQGRLVRLASLGHKDLIESSQVALEVAGFFVLGLK